MKFINLKYYLALFTVFALTIIYSVNSYYKNKFIQDELNLSLQELKTNYNIISFHYQNVADAYFDSIRNNERFTSTIQQYNTSQDTEERNHLRNELYSYIVDSFNGTNKLGIKTMLFSDPSNHTILRMHQPEKYGDDLTSIRFGITYVNSQQKAIFGFETGIVTHAFRYIYPIFDSSKNFLGSLDIGFSSSFLQNTLDIVHKLHTHFIVRKDIIPKETLSSENYQQSVEHDQFVLSKRKHAQHTFKLIVKDIMHKNRNLINQMMNNGNAFSLYGTKDDTTVISSFIPIFNLKDRSIADAYIVSHRSNEQIERIIQQFNFINIAAVIIVLLIIVFLYKDNLHKQQLEMKVEEKTRELQNINDQLEQKVQEEVAKNIQHEIKLYEQSKLAALGDMIGNIVHQWRQPLSSIVSIVSAIRLHNDIGILKPEDINNGMDKVVLKSQYLSETIDTFRHYLREEKVRKKVILQDRIDVALTITSTVLDDSNIKLINEINYKQPITTHIVLGELSQVIINVINNAKDILVEKRIEDPWVKISLEADEDYAYILIEDNAGGIPEEIMEKIFEQYFTTKDEDNGTGLGLYMSKKIMQDSFFGDLTVKNSLDGALFTLQLKLID